MLRISFWSYNMESDEVQKCTRGDDGFLVGPDGEPINLDHEIPIVVTDDDYWQVRHEGCKPMEQMILLVGKSLPSGQPVTEEMAARFYGASLVRLDAMVTEG